jgi:DNA-binding response OmpR family regulator
VSPRILIAEPDDDVRELLELTVRRLGYEVVGEGGDADAVLLEPAYSLGRSLLRRLNSAVPVVCLSIYPREEGLEPSASVAYLTKPASTAQISAALRGAVAVQPAY